nr:hypothetical protein [Chlorogloeopsis fritschii]
MLSGWGLRLIVASKPDSTNRRFSRSIVVTLISNAFAIAPSVQLPPS